MSEAQAPYPRKYSGLKTIAIIVQILALLTIIVGIAYLVGGAASAYAGGIAAGIPVFVAAVVGSLGLSLIGLAIELFVNMAFDQQRQADAMERIANRRRDG